ncbi:MAG: hypothetical protein LBV18_01710 [Alistipes sp.]|jgi:hypothetical protein|nr:hypothetical protein [Alistipes sp.]
MKIGFQENIHQKTDRELSMICKDVSFYSSEERLIALNELERRGALTPEMSESKKFIEEERVPMPDSVSILSVYKNNQFWLASMLGGPLAAGYMAAANFKAFDEPQRAKTAWIYAVAATVIVFGVIFLLPDAVMDKIPNYIIPAIYTGVAYLLVDRFQGKKIDAHRVAGGRVFSWGRVFAIGLIGAAVTLLSAAAIILTLY